MNRLSLVGLVAGGLAALVAEQLGLNATVSFWEDPGPFVLRVAGAETGLLGIDRKRELEAATAAAELGVGPEVIAFVEPEGCLITRFVEGETGRVTIAEAASLLRRLHAGRPIPGRFDALHVVDEYAESAQARGAV